MSSDATLLLQLSANGLVNGTVYALVALGLVLIHRVTRIINFAHSEFYMAGAFVGYVLHVVLGVHFLFALLATGLVIGLLASGIDLGVVRRLRDAPLLNIVIATFAISFILKGIARLIWGSQTYPFPQVVSGTPIVVFEVALAPQRLLIVGSAVAVMLGLFFFFRYSKFGKAMHATAQNPEAARLMGIPVQRMTSLAWGLGGGLAACAGLLLAPLISISPDMGGPLLFKAFTASIVGGIDSPTGAIAAGLLLGVIEVLVGFFISTNAIDIVSLLLLIAVVMVRPTGLFGFGAVERV